MQSESLLTLQLSIQIIKENIIQMAPNENMFKLAQI